MTKCFFVSDLHGKTDRYAKLFHLIETKKPHVVFFGGDLLPHAMNSTDEYNDFATDYFFPNLEKLKNRMNQDYPAIFLILGNDDPAIEEEKFLKTESKGLFRYMHNRKFTLRGYTIFGYSFIPPTPFTLKDWEKYDVSRYVDPGCTHPMEGYRSKEPDGNVEFETISKDLEVLTGNENLSHSVFLFHAPPYKTNLDRAALDGKMVDHVPLDVHVGSIAIKRFIDERQPYLTLHGHIHESTRLTKQWSDKFGNTLAFNAAHDGPELCVVVFDLEKPQEAERLLG